jgi:copper chaperone CopZ
VIQDTILNSKWEEKIRRIVTTNNLHIDQGAAIENLVLITMLGIEVPENFVENAKEYAKVSEEQAYNISAEVEREIFGDIRRKLIEISDTADTVEQIDQTTNELDKVAAAIEKEAAAKPSLKEKIPTNYFKEDKPAPVAEIKEEISETIPAADLYKEPLEEKEVIEIVPKTNSEPEVKEIKKEIKEIKPIFNPMPKEISPQNSQTVVKTDPYREPIE